LTFDTLVKSLGGRKIRILFQILGVLLFVLILVRVDLSEVLAYFGNLTLADGIVLLLILICFTFVKGLRWRLLVSRQGLSMSPARAFAIYSSSLYLGVVTPGRVGDFIKSLYLINRGMSAGKSIFSCLVDRMFDIIFLVLFGYTSLLFFPGLFENQYLMSTGVLIVTATVAIYLFWRRDIVSKVISKFASLVFPTTLIDKTDRAVADLLGEFENLDKPTTAAVALYTLLAWILHYATFIYFAHILSIDLSVPLVIVIVSAAIFTALIPVSLSGLGTRELVLIVIFANIGLTREAAVAFSFSFILVYIVQSVIGMICWLTGPLHSGSLSKPGPS
jgi:uncharacterized protein (TIRG00374 family)